MSLEQFTLATINDYKGWQGLNNFVNVSRFLVQGIESRRGDGSTDELYVLPTYLPPSMPFSQPREKDILSFTKSSKENKKEQLVPVRPLWFLSPYDEYNSLEFVEYVPPALSGQQYPVNYTNFYKNFVVLAGDSIITQVESSIPFNFYSSQNPSQLGDTSAINFLMAAGSYNLSFNQFNVLNTCGTFSVVFTDPNGNASSGSGLIDFNSLPVGLNTIGFPCYVAVSGLCRITITNFGSSTFPASYYSNITDISVNQTYVSLKEEKEEDEKKIKLEELKIDE